MTHHWIPSTFSVDSLTWTFYVSASVPPVLLAAAVAAWLRARRRKHTSTHSDTR